MRVSLFVTCMVDALYPNVGVSSVKLLRRLGVEVDFPEDQVCCGQPAFNSGYHDAARDAAAQLVRAFRDAEYVVGPSGSCVSMIRHYYPALFEGHPLEAEANAFAAKTYELSQFIVDVLGIDDVGARFPGRATYHTSCHMTRGLGVLEAPLRLLKNVRGLELVDLPRREDCCGFGGTFAVKMARLSAAMADEKLDHVAEVQAEYLVGADTACLMHLGGRLERRGGRVRVLHLAELLEEGTRPGVRIEPEESARRGGAGAAGGAGGAAGARTGAGDRAEEASA